MATARRTRTPPSAPPAVKSAEVVPSALTRRIETTYVDINDIAAYDWNPRNNEKAVKSVAASIRTFGFLVPCVIDGNNVLIAGHTRVEAAKSLGLLEVPCVRAIDLTPEEANAFRLIDNKVSEQAEWNYELLAGEMAKLESTGIDFTQFGWSESDISCLQDLVSADCLNATTLISPEETATSAIRRSPIVARVVIGEIVFMVPAEQYHRWADGIRALHSFSEEAIAEDLKRRLGMLED